MTVAVYSDDLTLLTNTPVQVKSLLQQTAEGIELYVNASKIIMCFKQEV